MSVNPGLIERLRERGEAPDVTLARTYMPILQLDENEPYPPLAMGYSVFRAPGQSPSSKFQISPRGAMTIEYAVWYDWDIQHLFDLEHVWVHVDGDGQVIGVEASCHGNRVEMIAGDGLPQMAGTRPMLISEPGKHAHWASADILRDHPGAEVGAMCGELAGRDGVHLGNRFAESGAFTATPADHRLARLKNRRDAFVPSFEFSPAADDIALVSWPELAAWIPARVRHLLATLPDAVPHIRAVFLDCGDTLVDEGTEVKLPGSEIVVAGDLIDGARDVLDALAARGYRLALVADGPRETFENLLGKHGLWERFEAHVISGEIGELKPSPKMFSSALDRLGIDPTNAGSTVMVGNNLSRDIRGANDFGIMSVFFKWSDRRTHLAQNPAETPGHTITALDQLPPLLDMIEQRLGASDRGRMEAVA
ncbi:HAD family hydrolase [Pelagibacterium limicola]|uniref:HAD family hydrolase n=1 Tax=Pelagibacterium limicola TaxID=2791022 RepID=UPI0018AFA84D|nr:HAD-IA family hydrolase [Pelagibacterium limicola]